ncbi:hypothetical protein ACP70R_037478 [Stipagrostis hirtigluma subsp. patula]
MDDSRRWCRPPIPPPLASAREGGRATRPGHDSNPLPPVGRAGRPVGLWKPVAKKGAGMGALSAPAPLGAPAPLATPVRWALWQHMPHLRLHLRRAPRPPTANLMRATTTSNKCSVKCREVNTPISRARSKNYLVEEDVEFVKAWESVSLDATIGTDQGSTTYWNRIEEHYKLNCTQTSGTTIMDKILKDESTREQYDYAIAHPKEVFYNTAQYYRAYYGHKTDPRAVLIGLLLIVSAFQYINQLTRYNQAIESVKQTPAYKNRLKALEFERRGGIASKKKGHKQVDKKVEEELSNEVELQIHGVEKPSVWRLYGVQFILLPYSIGKALTWEICWLWRYRVKKLPYAWEDACYLTRTSLKISANQWKNMVIVIPGHESMKENLVTRRLWEKSNMERYNAEMRKESKRRR